MREKRKAREVERGLGVWRIGGPGRGEVEKRVVRGEVVTVVESRDMVQEGVLEEWLAIDSVHEDIQDGEGGEGGEEEDDAGFCEEGGQKTGQGIALA